VVARPGGPASAVLWDMDGTLVDSEPFWIDAELALARRHGGTWSAEDGLLLVGSDLLEAGAVMRDRMGIALRPAQIVEELLDDVTARMRREVPWRPGARELLADLGAAGVPCALVTMSWRRFVAPVLAALPAGTFAAVVTGDAVARPKPHPDPYLAAAAALGVRPEDCVAIEDSDRGATSAERAGCRVLVVPHHVPVPPGEARAFRHDLVGLAAADLAPAVR
jgi:HAD superfamily hydrolase (TIGR01509 family)